MTEFDMEKALEVYKDRISYISFEKDYDSFDDNDDIAIYINLYDSSNVVLNSREFTRVKTENIANDKINKLSEEYRIEGYLVR